MSILNKEHNQTYKVVGVSFENDDGTSRQAILSKVTPTTKVTLVREPNNKFDENAVAVYVDLKTKSGNYKSFQCGYLGAHYAGIIAPKLDQGDDFDIRIKDCGHFNKKYILHIIINPMN